MRELGFLMRMRGVAMLVALSLLFPLLPIPAGQNTALMPEGTVACFAEATDAGITLPLEDVKTSSRIWEIIFGKKDENGSPETKKQLAVGGMLFGIRVKGEGLTVTEVTGDVGLAVGDLLLSLDGIEADSAQTVRKIASESAGKEMTARVRRGGEICEIPVRAAERDGQWKLGILLRDGAAGIGTVTYFDPETGEFGGLGHSIGDSKTGEAVRMKAGEATGVVLGGATRGEVGKPGELRGALSSEVVGRLEKNCEVGIFGRLYDGCRLQNAENTEVLPVGTKEELHTGKALIRSTVKSGAPQDYEIEITDISQSEDGTKSFSILVTDPLLIAMTGGIIRGMSGSPILQDGKLVGAVTHVLIGNPREGFGIYIENMLEAAESDSRAAA